MRLLILVPGHTFGGAEVAAGHVADRAVRRGHRVVVGTSRPDALRGPLAELEAVRIPVSPEQRRSLAKAVFQIGAHGAHVIYSNHRWPTLCARPTSELRRTPVVHHAQSAVEARRGTWWGTATVAVSEAIRSLVIAQGARSESVHLVHNGATARDALEDRTPGDLRVLFVGRLVPGKGVEVLIDAMADVPEARLLVVGDGPLRGSLEAQAHHAMGERVEFLGWVEDPSEVTLDADIGVVPTDTYPEGLPLVAAEFMQAGLAVVTTDAPGLSEAIGDSDAGLVVPRGDATSLAAALRKLVEDSRRRETLGQRARARAREHFDATVQADRVVDICEQLLADRT